MVCPRCGSTDTARYDPQARFCGVCGARLDESSPAAEAPPSAGWPQPPVLYEEPPAATPQRSLTWLLAGGALVVTLALAGTWSYRSSHRTAGGTGTYSPSPPVGGPSTASPPATSISPVLPVNAGPLAQSAEPVPYRVSGAQEAETLPIVSAVGCRPQVDTLEFWGPGRWSGCRHLMCAFEGPNGHVELQVAAPRDGTYDVCVYLTVGPHTGITAVALDGRRIGKPVDLRAQYVSQSGRIVLGRTPLKAGAHILRFDMLGRNPRSTGWDLGIDCVALVPPRAPTQHPVDLAAYCNHWRGHEEKNDNEFLVMAHGCLPRGEQVLGGTRFRVSGIVQLGSRSHQANGDPFPKQVTGIPIGRTCRRVHFLHTTGYWESDGARVGTYVVRYADGRRVEVPIVYGADVREWVCDIGPVSRAANVWSVARPGHEYGAFRVYRSTWANPRPAVSVKSIDFVSAWSKSGPMLLAVTAE